MGILIDGSAGVNFLALQGGQSMNGVSIIGEIKQVPDSRNDVGIYLCREYQDLMTEHNEASLQSKYLD